MKLIYTANTRIPSEKAHPYQIVQMCEAFAQSGIEVTLIYANRRNPPELRTDDLWAFYSVEPAFNTEHLPVLDVFPIAQHFSGRLRWLWENLAALLVLITFSTGLIRRLMQEADAIVYSRDPLSLALIVLLWPHRAQRLFYEAHTFSHTRLGTRLRRWLASRIGGIIVITEQLQQRYDTLGVPVERLLVAHDAIRRSRFAIEGDRSAWRRRIGWPEEAFIIGYMGRFQTLGMDKGLGDLVEAVIELEKDRNTSDVCLGLVGGPGEYVETLRARLREAGVSDDVLLYAGQIPPADVPGFLRAFNVCVMPFPWTEHFAYYASPMKLFEYMASGSAIVATNLPSTAEVISHEQNGLLTPPSDVPALVDALRRLRDDPALAKQLASQATMDVDRYYTWEARAQRILEFIQQNL